MKYIIMEGDEGALFPILFPELLVHADMVVVSRHAIMQDTKQYTRPTSAGFVDLGTKISVHGKSESLGDMPSNPADAGVIGLGVSVMHMPRSLILPLWRRVEVE